MTNDAIYFISGVVLILLGFLGYLRKVREGDAVIQWLRATDEALEREIREEREARPWALPAAKGIKRNHVIQTKPDRWVH